MSSRFAQRSQDVEIMDDLNCKGDVVNQTLRELEFINRTLGGNQITTTGVKTLLQKKPNLPIEIIDLGCGGGDMLALLARKFSKENGELKFVGVDANPNIIDFARKSVTENSNIQFEAVNILSDNFKSKTFDIAIATLFFHHFSSAQLVDTLRCLHTQCRVGMVINDLHRHPLAYYSIKLLTFLFSKSSMVKFDAPLSVLRGFSRNEIEEILEKAGIKNYSLHWRWAFRWKVVINKM